MPENAHSRSPGIGELPALDSLLSRAARFSDRCTICLRILENQGARTDVLNPLAIGGVSIPPEAQRQHLLGHPGGEA